MLNALGLVVLALVLFVAGRVAGGTIAYFTNTQDVAGNTLSAAGAFAPSGLGASVTGSSVALSWTAPSGGWATGYRVYRGTASGGPYSLVSSGGCAAPVAGTSCTDSSLADATYYYVVRGISANGGSAVNSNEATAIVLSTPPTVSSTNPADTATNVPLNSTIELTFSQAMQTGTVESAFSASPPIACTWSWNGPTNTVGTCTPSANLAADTAYSATISTDAKNVGGTALASAYQFTFTSFATTGAPSVTSVNPFDGAAGVGTNTSVAVTFSQTMNQGSAQGAFTLQQTSGSPCYVYGSTPLCASNGGSFSWSANNTLTFTPTSALQASATYAVAVSTAAQNTGGTALASAFSSSFTTAAAADTTPPQVIPPTTPASDGTGVVVNASITLTFSEGMNNAATQGAFSLKPCTDDTASCTSPDSAVAGSFTWGGAGNNILTFNPTSNLDSSQWHQVTVSTAATDLAGNAMAAPYSFVFETGTTSVSAPAAPTVTTPSAEEWTANTTYTITGTAEVNALVEIWSDGGTLGTIDGTDTVVASQQLAGGLTAWSISVNLATSAANSFQATAKNSAGLRSSPTIVSVIHQGDNTTTIGLLSLSPGSDNISVTATFTGDSDGDNSATAEYRTCPSDPCSGSFTSAGAMTRGTEVFTKTIASLAKSTRYEIQVTYTDADGVSGTNPLTATTTTLDGTQTGLIGSVTTSAPFASRAPQSASISVSVLDDTKSSRITINTSPAKTLPCDGTWGPATITFTWDGTNGATPAVPVADGNYLYTIESFNGNNCGNAAEQQGGNLVIVSNARSITLSPRPATITLQPGESVAITATVTNRRDELVPDGAPVSWTATGSVSGSMNGALSPAISTTTGTIVGTSYAECSVSASAGQACTKLTIPAGAKVSQTITITATMNTQLSGTTLTTVSGSTTVLDPPLPPEDVQLSQGGAGAAQAAPRAAQALPAEEAQRTSGGLRIRWRPSQDLGVVGYVVSLGTESGKYPHTADVGNATEYLYQDVTPGTRYYVVLRAYSRDKVLSPATREASLQIPAAAPTPTATATATPTPTATPTATATATPTATATATATPTATPAPCAPASATPTPSPTAAASASSLPTLAVATPTPGAEPSALPCSTATPSPSATATATETPPPTLAASPTPAATPTETASPVPPTVATSTPVPSPTAPPASATPPPAPSPTATAPAVPSPSPTPLPTSTPLPSATATPSPVPTAPPPTSTPLPSPTPTAPPV